MRNDAKRYDNNEPYKVVAIFYLPKFKMTMTSRRRWTRATSLTPCGS